MPKYLQDNIIITNFALRKVELKNFNIMARTYNHYVINDGTTAWVGDWSDAFDHDDEYGREVIRGFDDIDDAQDLADSINSGMSDDNLKR